MSALTARALPRKGQVWRARSFDRAIVIDYVSRHHVEAHNASTGRSTRLEIVTLHWAYDLVEDAEGEVRR